MPQDSLYKVSTPPKTNGFEVASGLTDVHVGETVPVIVAVATVLEVTVGCLKVNCGAGQSVRHF